ncbi:MAG: dimethylmenaquinone methyltransferase [Pseudolabrys sp.]
MTDNIVYLRIDRADPTLVKRAAAIPVSDLYEALPAAVRDTVTMTPRMRALAPRSRMTGPAVTARCKSGDNLMLHKALLLAERGDVLVVDGGEPSAAMWGDLAAVYADRKGLAGVVVDGCVRDVDALLPRQHPVWCTTISPAHPEKRGGGAVNVPIVCDGVLVHPGDIVCGDSDGVLVLPRDHAEAAIAKAESRMQHEGEILKAIDAGKSLFELHDLAAPYAQSGVREIDGFWKK